VELTEQEIIDLFPLQDPLIKCGLRLDLPKKQRRHEFAELGLDARHAGDGSFQEVIVFACIRCGTDRIHKVKEENETAVQQEHLVLRL
jgi:hypothetical protein